MCLLPSEVGFSLIDRLVREVIKITRGVLARVFFWGFGGWNRGRFWGFLLLSRKCSISSFLNPFFILSHLRLLIFRIFQNPRHFRTARDAQAAQAWSKSAGLATARSGVYMVIGETDSVIRFGFLVVWMDAHFRYYSTAPPDCSLSRQSETAGRVKKGLGF